MEITHYGHACVLVEIPSPRAPVRVLVDPGCYSRDFEDLRGLDLILVTHAHPDHLDTTRLPALLENNPDVDLVVGASALAALNDLAGADKLTLAGPGDTLSMRGLGITVSGGEHAGIHPALPGSQNNGYLLAGGVFHPGDAWDEPPGPVAVLLLPVGGPWMKIGEGIDYLRSVAPAVAIPIHQAGLAPVHQNMHYQLLKNLAPAGTEVVVLELGVTRGF